MNKKSILQNIFSGLIFVCLTASAAFAQTTAFTYQGRLTDTGTSQSSYQMRFELYDALTVGNQVGATITNPSVTVMQGVFTVQLDFGATAFDGTNRFLEIAVRRNAGDPFTILTPRRQIDSSPYSIRALNSAQADVALDSNRLGGIDASEYVTTTTVGNSFIRNGTTAQTGNFNISGIGIVGDSLGIGVTPGVGIKLDVIGDTRISRSTGFFTQFGSPSGETGMSIIAGPGRADLRFDGTTLKLVAGPVGGPPSELNGIVIGTEGTVNIGTGNYNAGAQLDVFSNEGATVRAVSNNVNATAFFGNNTAGGLSGDFGRVKLRILGGAGATPICLNSASVLSNCSSSYRYKKDFQSFGDGLSFINQLRPIAYKWKADNMLDVGFGAEDVEKINPLFVTYNDKGEVEGVKYDRLSVVFVNAFKEQQAQIERQQKQIEQQRLQIENLKKLMCLDHPNADICREK